MQHNAPDFRYRSQRDELMDAPCSREEMRACLCDLAWTNRWTLAYRPQMHWLDSLADKLSSLSEPICILDVACGYGDGLRKIEQWARKRGIAVELTGLELNADATVIAAEATPASSRIQWVTADVFTYVPPHVNLKQRAWCCSRACDTPKSVGSGNGQPGCRGDVDGSRRVCFCSCAGRYRTC